MQLFAVRAHETKLGSSRREDFWFIVAARSEDETEIRAGQSSGRMRRSQLKWHQQCHSPLSNNPKLQTLRTSLWFAARVVVSVLPPSIVVTDMALVEVMPCVEGMLTTAAIAATNIKKRASAPFSLLGQRARQPI